MISYLTALLSLRLRTRIERVHIRYQPRRCTSAGNASRPGSIDLQNCWCSSSGLFNLSSPGPRLRIRDTILSPAFASWPCCLSSSVYTYIYSLWFRLADLVTQRRCFNCSCLSYFTSRACLFGSRDPTKGRETDVYFAERAFQSRLMNFT